ncbi:transposase [Alkalicella caledoniensis]|uniref:Transposase n=1 Tax=Alkalicella caledoniensis TaxID=2731377 RepID=A0A7G9W3V3_ALKCA|nr:transposase [Alkalicella caledoniensis]
MVRWKMYSDIHHFKDIGLNKTQVANRLNLNYKTVRKYWDVTPDEFLEIQKSRKARKLDKYHDPILTWLKQFPDISTAQIHDWLLEHYQDKTIKDRTLRNYIMDLRKKHNIPKQRTARQYQAVVDPPMGYQLQVDFGETKLRSTNGGKTKVYGMGAVLSNSRFKYSEWVDKPFTTSTLISMLNHCFEYIGGVPKELVFDQDKIATVNENYGDIIYTYEFEKYKKTMGFKVHLCKAYDPESKGYVKTFVM